MDVHRVRFIQHSASNVTCYAFSRSQDTQNAPNRDDLRLAVGRSDGSIEIWNPANGAWIHETTFPPSGQDSVDSLVWTQDPSIDGAPGQLRLFSIGSSSNVAEWNLATGTVKRRNTGNFDEVWCFAAQPQQSTAGGQAVTAQDLVVGCGDGTVAVLSTAEDDLQFKRFLARTGKKKARCLTITYQTSTRVVAGFADGVIRVFDANTGNVIRTMSLGAGLPGAPKTTLIWKVLSLPGSGDLVSADSNGELRVWDGKNYSMTHRMKGHDGDCLDVVCSTDGKLLFSGGVDERIASYRATTTDRGRTSWIKTSHRRVRAGYGPVKALAAYDGTTSVVMVAGSDSEGDAGPIAVPLRRFAEEHQRQLYSLPSGVVSAPKARLVVSWQYSTISIYKFRALQCERSQQNAYQLVAKISLDSKHIRSASISSTGRLLAVSTSDEVKLFQLKQKQKSPSREILAVRKVVLPRAFANLGARLVTISADEKWLAIATPGNEVHVSRIESDPSNPKLFRVLEQTVELEPSFKTSDEPVGVYQSTLNQLVFNEDSDMLVTSDLAGTLNSWILDEATRQRVYEHKESAPDSSSDDDEDDDIEFYGQIWNDNPAKSPPRLESMASVLSFRPGKKHSVLTVTARHQVVEYDLSTGTLTDWARRRPASTVPQVLRNIRDDVTGHMWDSSSRLWLHGYGFLVMLDLDAWETASDARKRRREDNDESQRADKKQQRGPSEPKLPSAYNIAGPEHLRKTDAAGTAEVELGGAVEQEDEEIEMDLGAVHDDEDAASDHADKQLTIRGKKHSWHTYKYRPIMGVVSLAKDDEAVAVEMVVVEQPRHQHQQQETKKTKKTKNKKNVESNST